MRIVELSSLSFLYDPDHFSWLKRHRLNAGCKREIRAADKKGTEVAVANELVAEELHRYYRVPKERIIIDKH